MKFIRLYLKIVLSFLLIHPSYSQHSLLSELKSFTDIGLLPKYRNAITAQVSSYDTTGGNDDGFSGKYSFIQKINDSSLLLFDQKGPGVIQRIWTPTPSEDTLDFYIDGTLCFSIQYLDLFSGKVFPFVAPLCGNQLGGYYCYLPIPYSQSCQIIYRGKRTQFHQIGYATMNPGKTVKSFTMNLSGEEKNELSKIAMQWSKSNQTIQDIYHQNVKNSSSTLTLNPQSARSIFFTGSGGRILGIEISPSESLESLLKDIDIKINWDHEKVPAVYCPLADYFGYAFGHRSMQSYLVGSDPNKAYSYIPMPFDHSASLQLISRRKKPITLHATIYYIQVKRNSIDEGKLYTQWNSSPETVNGKPHILLRHEGKGHYIGTILQAQGLKPGMTYFFEGDDSTVMDGVMRYHGTGSEDHFNGGWYALMDRWDHAMSLPIHGALDYSLLFGRTGAYRFYLNDKMSFTQCINHTIEHGPVNNDQPGNYTSLSFFYSDRSPTHCIKPDAKNSTVYISDTLFIYPQLMESTTTGQLSISTNWRYNTGGESYRYDIIDQAALRITMPDVPIGHYQVYLDTHKEPNGINFSLWQRQSQVSDWIDLRNETEQRMKYISLGRIAINQNVRTLTFRMRGKGGLWLHRLMLVKS